MPGNVDDFSDEKEAGDTAFHGLGRELRSVDSSSGDFCFGKALGGLGCDGPVMPAALPGF